MRATLHRLDRQLLRQPCFPLQLGTSTGRCIDASTTMLLRRQAPAALLQPHAPGRPLPALSRSPGISTPGPCRASNSNSSQWFPQAGGDEPSTRPANSSADEQPSSSTSGNSNGSESSSSAGSPSSSGSSEGNGKPAEQSEVDRGPLPMVPWGVGKVAQVMLLWLIAYVTIGQVAVPITMSLLGLDRETMSIRSHAIVHLGIDVSQLAITLLILWRCLKPFDLKRLGLFPVRWRGMWPLLVAAACLTFPVVDWVAQQSHAWFPLEGDQWANQMEYNLSLGDWITNVSYFCLVSICAPVWEEAIFRGFLLASLARYMSVQAAVVASSLLFAMCHFRLQTFLPLLVLGIIFSSIFLLTRNLLSPIILHSLWNIFVLYNLLCRPV